MFIKDLSIKNLRCFSDKTITGFNVPDGTSGSGLNIFIGENGTGKTTVLEAINFLTQSSYATSNTLDLSDFKDIAQDINISYTSHQNFKFKMPPIFRGCYFEASGLIFNAQTRKNKSPGKLLSSSYQVGTSVNNITSNYMNSTGDSGKPIVDFFKGYSPENVDGDELNIFYFDKNRTRHLTQGNYTTTFERICDDLNWKFVKSINEDAAKKQALIDGLNDSYFKQTKDVAHTGVGAKVADELADFFDDNQYKNLKIDIIEYLAPFKSGLLALRKDDVLQQIMSKDLGSGVEMIIALLMLKNIGSASKGKIVYLIDEPEAHLHPKAQKELLRLLIEESKDKQIFLSTHSPYIFKDAISTSAGLLIFKRESGEVEIANARDSVFGHFPWSPSWGEVNFSAYDLPTVELHNELYGHIQEQTRNVTEAAVESYFVSKGCLKPKQWRKVLRGTLQAPYDVTLYTYIRNLIHHPENTHNPAYSDNELRQSISEMLALVEAGL